MRYENWRTSENVEDQRPLPQRFQVLPMDGYLGAVGTNQLQEMVNERIAGLGSDLPAGPVAPSEYRPRGVGPERPPVQQAEPGDPDYRRGGPERNGDQDMRSMLELLQAMYPRR
jgi:hypothetical protein